MKEKDSSNTGKCDVMPPHEEKKEKKLTSQQIVRRVFKVGADVWGPNEGESSSSLGARVGAEIQSARSIHSHGSPSHPAKPPCP